MGFLDKLISKLDDNPDSTHPKPMDSSQGQYQPQAQYGQPAYHSPGGYQQTGYGGDHHQAGGGYVQQPPVGQGQGQGYGHGYGHGQEYGQGQAAYGQVDPTTVRTQAAQSLLQTFQSQLSTAQMNLQNGPAHDPAFRVKMETEVKILMAVVGVCQGFVGGSDQAVVDGMRGMGLGAGYGQGHPVDPYASNQPMGHSSSTDKPKTNDDKKKLMMGMAGAGAVGLGAGMLLADGDSDREEELERELEREREKNSGSGSGSDSDSDSGSSDGGEDDE